MSGGHFDYWQWHISEIANQIEDVIYHNGEEKSPEELNSWDYDEHGNVLEYAKYHYKYSPEVIEKFKEAAKVLKTAYVYAQRVDWLLSGDDGEDDFLERLEEDLNALKT